jgi:hypothetical protein
MIAAKLLEVQAALDELNAWPEAAATEDERKRLLASQARLLIAFEAASDDPSIP